VQPTNRDARPEAQRLQKRDEEQDTEQPVRRHRPLVDDEAETSDFRIPRF
jgi:hypothetical protein